MRDAASATPAGAVWTRALLPTAAAILISILAHTAHYTTFWFCTKAIEATGRKNIIMTGLWTEVCVTWPTIEMLGAGYNIYVVEDCCGATSPAAQEAALSRMVQAGAVRLTTIGALLEFQRDWKNKEHYNALMGILKQQGGAYGVGVEYAYTMVHHAPQSAQKPQVVPKAAAH